LQREIELRRGCSDLRGRNEGVPLHIAELKKAHQDTGITCGLELIRKMHFATITRGTQSVKHCTPVLKLVVARKKVSFENSECFLPNTKGVDHLPLSTLTFEIKRDEILLLTTPFAKAIICLEATETNPMDVFLFVHAALTLIEEALESEVTAGIAATDKDTIYAILNHCYNQVFSPNGSLHSPVYLAVVYLNSNLLQSDLFIHSRDTAV
jgi:hypothetical protein